MTHSHAHTHEPNSSSSKVGKGLLIGITLNLIFVVVEAGTGFWQDSLSLLADAGHNLFDVASLALALLAFRLAKVKPNAKFTYGYRKSTILVALLNAVILLIAIGGIGFEAFQRIWDPQPIEGGVIAIVAGVGILVNGFTAFLFIKEKDKDLNIKGAYLHMAADAIVSLGVVIAGLLIMWTDWYLLDPIISFVIMIVILISTWSLLKDSLVLTLDGVPKGINLNEVKNAGLNISGVMDLHHIHIWAISTTQNALTAHLVVKNGTPLSDTEIIKDELKQKFSSVNIQHCTFEIEAIKEHCSEKDCKTKEDTAPEIHHH
ncbi:MAG TPA: cation diffusion facilitator family transporter [Chitinophagaceae bacterium]|nr:cation diffusion facilitator family transporter [Chitinophagaceae bacterium]